MNASKDNPRLALTTLEKIAEEIPSGVSAQEVGEIITTIGGEPEEITDNIRAKVAAELKGNIGVFWESYSVNEKLRKVKDLERSEVKGVWPPLSAEVMVTTTNADYLRIMKETYQERIGNIKEENQALIKLLRKKSELVRKQMDDVKSCDFVL